VELRWNAPVADGAKAIVSAANAACIASVMLCSESVVRRPDASSLLLAEEELKKVALRSDRLVASEVSSQKVGH